jgi:hypothetical protein
MVLSRSASLVAPLLACVAGCGPEPGPEPGSELNLLLVSLDTTRADHLSCYGYARPTTPVLRGITGR